MSMIINNGQHFLQTFGMVTSSDTTPVESVPSASVPPSEQPGLKAWDCQLGRASDSAQSSVLKDPALKGRVSSLEDEETRRREWQARAKSYNKIACVQSQKGREEIANKKASLKFLQSIFPVVASVESPSLTPTHGMAIMISYPEIDKLEEKYTVLIMSKDALNRHLRTFTPQELKLLHKFSFTTPEQCPYSDEELKNPDPEKFDFFIKEQRNWFRILTKANWIQTIFEEIIGPTKRSRVAVSTHRTQHDNDEKGICASDPSNERNETCSREVWQTRAHSYDKIACVRSEKVLKTIADIKATEIATTTHEMGTIDALKDKHTGLVMNKDTLHRHFRTFTLQELKLLRKMALNISEECPYSDDELKYPNPEKFDFFMKEQRNWFRVLTKVEWIRTILDEVIQEYLHPYKTAKTKHQAHSIKIT